MTSWRVMDIDLSFFFTFSSLSMLEITLDSILLMSSNFCWSKRTMLYYSFKTLFLTCSWFRKHLDWGDVNMNSVRFQLKRNIINFLKIINIKSMCFGCLLTPSADSHSPPGRAHPRSSSLLPASETILPLPFTDTLLPTSSSTSYRFHSIKPFQDPRRTSKTSWPFLCRWSSLLHSSCVPNKAFSLPIQLEDIWKFNDFGRSRSTQGRSLQFSFEFLKIFSYTRYSWRWERIVRWVCMSQIGWHSRLRIYFFIRIYPFFVESIQNISGGGWFDRWGQAGPNWTSSYPWIRTKGFFWG